MKGFFVVAALAVACLSATLASTYLSSASAQETTAQVGALDPALMEQGQALYNDEGCAGCHQADGSGIAPDFPALAGNENLSDAVLLVRNVHQGKGAMPAFPHLSADQIAVLGTYIRNDWGNQFGALSADEVGTILAELPTTADTASIWSGVSNQEQADRGAAVYSGVCSRCHGRTGNGAGDPDQPESPSVARATFLTKWDEQSLATLFEYVRTTMPIDNPGSRTDEEYIDSIVHMLVLSNVPLADAELPPDPEALAGYTIEPEPAE